MRPRQTERFHAANVNDGEIGSIVSNRRKQRRARTLLYAHRIKRLLQSFASFARVIDAFVERDKPCTQDTCSVMQTFGTAFTEVSSTTPEAI